VTNSVFPSKAAARATTNQNHANINCIRSHISRHQSHQGHMHTSSAHLSSIPYPPPIQLVEDGRRLLLVVVNDECLSASSFVGGRAHCASTRSRRPSSRCRQSRLGHPTRSAPVRERLGIIDHLGVEQETVAHGRR
jgi:hypothetical protein